MPAWAPAISAAVIVFLALPLPLGRRPTPDPLGRPRPFLGGFVGVLVTDIRKALPLKNKETENIYVRKPKQVKK